jgi:hypothetical protein
VIGNHITLPSIEFIDMFTIESPNLKSEQTRMEQNEKIRLKKRLNILFWCMSPFLFLAFLRLFWMLFQFVYGTLFIILFGKQFTVAISVIAVITSIVFTVLTFKYIYKQYKKHIVES